MARPLRPTTCALLAVVLVVGCDDAALSRIDAGPDASTSGDDASDRDDARVDPIDSGDTDAGPAETDAATRDAGDERDAARDAMTSDAGLPPPDAPEVPLLRAPWNGWASGSVHASPGGSARDPLRPRLRWEPVDGATHYVVQLSADCDPSSFRECTLDDSTDIEVRDATELTPPDRLPVSMTQPVGRRYYWRVRACDGDACSAFSPMRYLDVGRMKDDFDGDGYGDVPIGSPDRAFDDEPSHGIAWILSGSAEGLERRPAIELLPPDETFAGGFARIVAAIGDLQGDGFADLAISEPFAPGLDEGMVVPVGRVHVYFGSRDGIRAMPDVTLDFPQPDAFAWFGSGLAGGGDLDGDGYADLVAGAEQRGLGHGYVYRGDVTGIDDALAVRLMPPTGLDNFGLGLGALGDVDADGRCDVGIGAFATASPSEHAGWAGVYRGSERATLEARASGVLTPAAEASWIELGYFIAGALDANGDGFADVAVSAPYMDATSLNEGTVLLFSGSRDLIGDAPDAVLVGSDHTADGYFGTRVATGDFDGDGYDDLAVGEPLSSELATRAGRVWIVHGGPDLAALGGPIPLDSPRPSDGAQMAFVASSDVDGDGITDVLAAAPFEDFDTLPDVGALYVFHGSRDGVVTEPVVIPCPRSEANLRFGLSID